MDGFTYRRSSTIGPNPNHLSIQHLGWRWKTSPTYRICHHGNFTTSKHYTQKRHQYIQSHRWYTQSHRRFIQSYRCKKNSKWLFQLKTGLAFKFKMFKVTKQCRRKLTIMRASMAWIPAWIPTWIFPIRAFARPICMKCTWRQRSHYKIPQS